MADSSSLSFSSLGPFSGDSASKEHPACGHEEQRDEDQETFHGSRVRDSSTVQLAAVNQHLERVPAPDGEENIMRFGVQGHRPGAALGLESLHDGELVRIIFVGNRDGALAVGAKGQLRLGIESIGIHPSPIGTLPTTLPLVESIISMSLL